jgi:hypothetical protein
MVSDPGDHDCRGVPFLELYFNVTGEWVIKKHKCRFTDGTIEFDDSKAFRDDCLKLDGKEGFVSLHKEYKHRSTEQNAYLHGVILKMISDHTGQELESIKGVLKTKYLREKTPIGWRIKDTSELTTIEFESFNDDCRRWAGEFLSVFIPLPNEADYSKIY